MNADWNSLFFTYRPHADQRTHEARLLRDMGLTRTESGELALAEDPTHLIAPVRPSPLQRLGQAFQALFSRDRNRLGQPSMCNAYPQE